MSGKSGKRKQDTHRSVSVTAATFAKLRAAWRWPVMPLGTKAVAL